MYICTCTKYKQMKPDKNSKYLYVIYLTNILTHSNYMFMMTRWVNIIFLQSFIIQWYNVTLYGHFNFDF